MYTAPHWKSPIALNGLAYYKSNDEVDKCLTISMKLPPIIHFLSDFRNRKIELTLMVTHEWILFAMGSLSAANEKIEIHSESGARHRRHPPLRAARFINSSVILNFVHRRVHFTKNHDQKKSWLQNMSTVGFFVFFPKKYFQFGCDHFGKFAMQEHWIYKIVSKTDFRFGLIN